jgi:hypothetical protein
MTPLPHLVAAALVGASLAALVCALCWHRRREVWWERGYFARYHAGQSRTPAGRFGKERTP